MAIKAEFKGTSLVPKDIKFPEIGMLTGDFGKEVLAEYRGRAEKDYGDVETLKVLSSGKVITGSNPFAVVLVNQIVRANGMRTATPADLEKALQAGVNLSGTYEDAALVLRSGNEPNKYLAESVANQLETHKDKTRYPLMIPLNGFDLIKDRNSPYGLAFKLRQDAQIIPARILNENGNFSSEDVDLETGLPKKVGGEGNRYIYVGNSGLSRLYLGGGLSLWSGGEILAVSDSGGRVLVVSAEGTSQKILDQYASKLQAQKREYEVGLARIAKAEQALKGE